MRFEELKEVLELEKYLRLREENDSGDAGE